MPALKGFALPLNQCLPTSSQHHGPQPRRLLCTLLSGSETPTPKVRSWEPQQQWAYMLQPPFKNKIVKLKNKIKFKKKLSHFILKNLWCIFSTKLEFSRFHRWENSSRKIECHKTSHKSEPELLCRQSWFSALGQGKVSRGQGLPRMEPRADALILTSFGSDKHWEGLYCHRN